MRALVSVAVAGLVLCTGCGTTTARHGGAAYSGMKRKPVPAGIHKIKHVVVIVQENRSFDSYFGTYSGADGFPARHGRISASARRTRPPTGVTTRTTIRLW